MGILADYQIKRDVKIEPFAEGDKRFDKISYGLGSYGYDARAGYIWKVFSPIMCREIDPKKFDKEALVTVDLTPLKCDWEFTPGDMRNPGHYSCKRCSTKVEPKGKESPIQALEKVEGLCLSQPQNYILIPPHSFVLGETVETFTIPRDVLCIVLGKSTYARCGLVVNVTPGEPEWTGKWTVEISNTTPLPARVYCGEGIMQCIFLRTDGHSEAVLNTLLRMVKHEVLDSDSIGGSGGTTSMFPPLFNEMLHRELANGTCKVSYADKDGKYQGQVGVTIPTVDKKE